MIHVPTIFDFTAWRKQARDLLLNSIPPEQIAWPDPSQPLLKNLFETCASKPTTDSSPTPRVPKDFLTSATTIAYHRNPNKWTLLYRIIWRITRGQPHLLKDEVDDDVRQLHEMEKSVRRDLHKMHAFVRFRKVTNDNGEHFIAWHRPDHLIVPAAGPWFARRFPTMHWSILTPDASVDWDTHQLRFGPGMTRADAPAADELEQLWLTYYASIFNPNRVKIKAMKKEMAVRHWPTLPETQLIPELLKAASKRANEMVEKAETRATTEIENTGSAAPFIPTTLELPVLQSAIKACKGCELYCHATQPVFGQGPPTASILFVGEQPGDQEDRQGRPFVGPAGQLFDQALQEIGIERNETYVTNAVKHFKFIQRGRQRIHSKPSAREMSACRPWLEAEIATIKPKLIVCLGATAAQTLMGPEFRITRDRGKIFTNTHWAPALLATMHPSAILRTLEPAAKEKNYQDFLSDLQIVRNHSGSNSR